MKIVFMGTPALAVPCLDALALDHEIVAVVTQPDKIGGRGHELLSSAVKKRALELEIPVLQPARARHPKFIEELRSFAPDGIAVVAFGQIWPARKPRNGAQRLRQSPLFAASALARRGAGAIRDLERRPNDRRDDAVDGRKTRCGRGDCTTRTRNPAARNIGRTFGKTDAHLREFPA